MVPRNSGSIGLQGVSLGVGQTGSGYGDLQIITTDAFCPDALT